MLLKLDYKYIPTRGGYTVPEPTRGSKGAAGLDLHAALDESIVLAPGERALVPLGMAIAVPRGFVGLLCGRSGMGVNYGVTLSNCIGVIDEDYRGELRVGLINHGKDSYTIMPGDRVCQLLLVPYAAAAPNEVEELSETERGTKGYGSTGK